MANGQDVESTTAQKNLHRSTLNTLCVEEHASVAGLVKFPEQDPLPLTKQHFTIDNRDGDRWLPNHHLTTVGVTVDKLVFLQVFGAHRVIIVFVVGILWHQCVYHPPEVIEKTGLGFIHHNCRSCVRAIDSYLAVPNTRSFNDLARYIGDVPKFHGLCGCEMESLGPNGRLSRFRKNRERTRRTTSCFPQWGLFLQG